MMNKYKKITLDGIIFNNPTFILVLGTCPTLGLISSALSALEMGLAVIVVLTLSNMIISALRKLVLFVAGQKQRLFYKLYRRHPGRRRLRRSVDVEVAFAHVLRIRRVAAFYLDAYIGAARYKFVPYPRREERRRCE